jgi:hypothetical protein
MKLTRYVGVQILYLRPQFHYFGMARIREIENYDGSPSCLLKTHN